MKKLLICFYLSLNIIFLSAQQYDIDALKNRIKKTTNDTIRIVLLDSISVIYSEINPDSSLFYTEEGLRICRELKFKLSEASAMNNKGYALMNTGNYPRSLQAFLYGLQIAEDEQNKENILPKKYRSFVGFSSEDKSPENYRLQILAFLNFNLGILYENTNNQEKEFFHYTKALQLAKKTGNLELTGVVNLNLGRLYLSQKKLDSALIFEKRAYAIASQMSFQSYTGSVLLNLGRVYLARGDKKQAIGYFHEAILKSQQENYLRGVIAGKLQLAAVNIEEKRIDSAFFYVNTAYQFALQLNNPDLLFRSYTTLSNYYNLVNNNDSIVKYQGLIIKIKDSLFNSTQIKQFQNIDFDEAQRQQELETAKKDYRNRLQKYMLMGGLGIFLFVVLILWRSNITKQRSYRLLSHLKLETDFQKAKVERTLEELKATQNQLIQSEKMASLGELTAGIAHEIQNPLNFVNNFSEVNKELLVEMKDELDKGNIDEVKALATDVIDNEEKIIFHGKRADAIVKGMLQHSRSSSGIKKLTDINALCDEYFRLSYHGLRAKDKSFNATIKTDFDSSIGKINIIPQDIGRVILNLLNNAFYAVNEKQKQNIPGYEPTVQIKTTQNPLSGGRGALITVSDNGGGISQKVLDKIFQPFFTTKPTGQGTGLGLSLSYDIIKAHGGEIKVETEENENTTFIILLSGSNL